MSQKVTSKSKHCIVTVSFAHTHLVALLCLKRKRKTFKMTPETGLQLIWSFRGDPPSGCPSTHFEHADVTQIQNQSHQKSFLSKTNQKAFTKLQIFEPVVPQNISNSIRAMHIFCLHNSSRDKIEVANQVHIGATFVTMPPIYRFRIMYFELEFWWLVQVKTGQGKLKRSWCVVQLKMGRSKLKPALIHQSFK